MGQQNVLAAIVPFIVMVAVFYIIVLLPEKKRKKKYNAMLQELKLNDEIVTIGGLVGKIIKIQDDCIILESGPDRTRMKFKKSSISSVTRKQEQPKEEKEYKEVAVEKK